VLLSIAIGSLDVENLFGTFQDLDPRGTGVLTPSDIPTALSVAIDLLDAKLNPNRYVMNTNFVSSNPAQGRCTLCDSLLVTCDRSLVFSGYSGFLYQ
jgi:hypothetical protein